ncbi:hypothetical protein VM1G_05463 [Cytospora mali]|uniref:Uncharacterized protein n=1 Tax=Cytospora mali TaxID=578113 RepID=A0A194W0H8_CYTMA|nr:hypothetical protein VM1G_05463 [Valsa mali]
MSGSNQRHRYFVGILRSAYEILHPFTEAREGQERPLPVGAKHDLGLPSRHWAIASRGWTIDDLDHVPDGEDSGPSTPDNTGDSYRLPDVGRVVVLRYEDEIEEEFIFAFFSFCLESHTVHIWAAFGVQVLLDIEDEQMRAKHVLDTAPEKSPLAEVKKHMRWRVYDFKKVYLDGLPRIMGTETFMKTYTGSIAIVLMRIKDEVVYDVHLGTAQSSERNPARCGMLKLDLYFQLHRRAFLEESCWFGMTEMVHVYLACRQIPPDDPVRPDMEHALGFLDLDHIFFERVPKSMDEAERKHYLALGVVPSSMARGTRLKEAKFDLNRWASEEKQAKVEAQWSDLSKTIPEILNTLALYTQYEASYLQFGWFAFNQTIEKLCRRISASVEETDGEQYGKLPTLVVSILEQAREVEDISMKTKRDTQLLRKKATEPTS